MRRWWNASPERHAHPLRRRQVGGLRGWFTAGLLGVAGVVGTGATGTSQEKAPSQKQEVRYADVETDVRHLGHSVYRTRNDTSKKLDRLLSHDVMVWLASLKDGTDAETSRRIDPLIAKQRPQSLMRYPVKYDDDWIDGTHFIEDGCNVRLPSSLWRGADELSNYQVTSLYLGKAARRGAKTGGSPDWPQYSAALQIYADELRDHYGAAELWNDAARKERDEWKLKNPAGDLGKFLVDRFDGRMKNHVLPKIAKHMEPFMRGSEKYRKNVNLPLKRPLGPMLRNDILPFQRSEDIAVVDPELVGKKKAG